MKSTLFRCATLALALTLLLCACGKESASWRTLNLEDEANAEIKAWLQTQFNPIPESRREPEPEQTEFAMGANKIITRLNADKYGTGTREIFLRAPNGEETVLLSGYYTDGDSANWPRMLEVIDDRYFLFEWSCWGLVGGSSVYDIQEMREIRVDGGDSEIRILERRENHLFFRGYDLDAPYYGPVELWLSDLSALPKAITPVNLLDGVLNTSAGLHEGMWLSPDERYYIVVLYGDSETDDELRIFDVKNRQFVAQFSAPKGTFNGYHAFLDNKTLYLYHTDWESRPVNDETNYALTPIAVEIKLL